MGKQRQFVIERYKCTKCGQEMTVPRAMGKRRPRRKPWRKMYKICWESAKAADRP